MIALIALLLAGELVTTRQHDGSGRSLRGLHAFSTEIVWATGTNGTVLLTRDGGKTWVPRNVPEAAALDFRDVHATSADTVFIQSAGVGAASRIYRSRDAGETWTLVHQLPDERGFFDGLTFWEPSHGIAYSDPVAGRFLLLETRDGGDSWQPLTGLPPAHDGEASFAASGTGIYARAPGHVWFGTGGLGGPRIFHSTDRGKTWTVTPAPLRSGFETAGCFSLVFWDARNGCAVGGRYDQPDDPSGTCVITSDGGRSWRPAEKPPHGYRSAVAIIPAAPPGTLVAVGTNGMDLSSDGGRTWTRHGGARYNAIDFAPGSATGWIAGVGTLERVTWQP